MARQARKTSKLNTYTIVLRGTSDIFAGNLKKQLFLDSIVKCKDNTAVYAYAITDKDAYLVVKDSEVSKFIKKITVSFARKYNLRYGLGKVFYDRYLSEPLNTNVEVLGAIKSVNLIIYGGTKTVHNGWVSSYFDYFSDLIIDTSFVMNNLHIDFTEYHNESISTGVVSLKRLSDEELVDFIYNKYGITATEINKLSKDKLAITVEDIMRTTKASARQIAKITTLPIRFLWSLAKKIRVGKETQ